ncbi:ABC transporter substrate-binding protein [Nocardioides endophyticus]|uniref:ABC transporter substrate-binding protein n=1 Tax=Nocardioides endophyticus TaxID=1353775 RepID=A0ABP8Z2C7_9ACTN
MLAGCADAPESEPAAVSAADSREGPAFPVDVAACGHTSTVETAPERAVTLNQGATEVMLALGLEDRMAGTAYLDDPEPPTRWADAYASVPVISKEYPKREELLAVDPDFVYASYASAFDPKVAGTPKELDALGVASYLSPFGCEDDSLRPEPSFEAVWEEIEAVGSAFGVSDDAAELVAEQQDVVAGLADDAAGAGTTVFWYDSGDKTALAGVGGGGPQVVIDATGATNIFGGIDGGWEDVSWEKVIAADPDVIALADASWSTADDKIAYLEKDPVLSQLRAVQDKSYVVVPYSQSTAGVTLVDGAASLAEQLSQLSS